jgi:hypothetical protein
VERETERKKRERKERQRYEKEKIGMREGRKRIAAAERQQDSSFPFVDFPMTAFAQSVSFQSYVDSI